MTGTDIAYPLLLGVLGLVFGSFIATVIVRWPQGRSIAQGRSHCDACDRVLRADELVPVASYLRARGRCRTCGARIAPVHLIVELAGLAIGVAAGALAPGATGIAGAVFGWQLLALAGLDLTAFWLPNRLTAALAITGVTAVVAGAAVPPGDAVLGGLIGFGSLWAVAAGYRRVRGRVGLGGGDPKLFGAIGIWLGWRTLPGVLLAACLVGLGVVLILRLCGRRIAAADRLPLGTLLALAAFGSWMAGLASIPIAR